MKKAKIKMSYKEAKLRLQEWIRDDFCYKEIVGKDEFPPTFNDYEIFCAKNCIAIQTVLDRVKELEEELKLTI